MIPNLYENFTLLGTVFYGTGFTGGATIETSWVSGDGLLSVAGIVSKVTSDQTDTITIQGATSAAGAGATTIATGTLTGAHDGKMAVVTADRVDMMNYTHYRLQITAPLTATSTDNIYGFLIAVTDSEPASAYDSTDVVTRV